MPEKVGEKLVHVFIINTETILSRHKIIGIYSDLVFAYIISSRILIIYKFMLKIITATHRLFFPKKSTIFGILFNCML